MAIGVIEGAAEALNRCSNRVGRLSDKWRARKPFVVAGTASPPSSGDGGAGHVVPHVLAVRLSDRWQGIRAAPRDALLARGDPATRGYVFGLHRSMDHAGAIVARCWPALFLWFYPEQYRTLFGSRSSGLVAVAMLLPVLTRRGESARPVDAPAASGPLGRASHATSACALFTWATPPTLPALRLSELGIGTAWIRSSGPLHV